MDFTALEIFKAVAAEGSVTRAAEQLGRVQSNVTTRIQQLEEQLGTPLFLRQGGAWCSHRRANPCGGYADRLLALAEEARQAVRPQQPGGRLRLGAMESIGRSGARPSRWRNCMPWWPDVVLDLSTGPSRQLVESRRTSLDAALVAWPPPGLETDTPVERTPVFQESLLLALPAHHPPVQSPPICNRHAGRLHTRLYLPHIGEAWMQRRGTAPQVLELASYHAIIACVAAGRCGCGSPGRMGLDARAPALRLVPLQTCDTVLVRRRGYQSPALDALLAARKAHSSPPPPGFHRPDPARPSKKSLPMTSSLLQRLGIALPIIQGPMTARTPLPWLPPCRLQVAGHAGLRHALARRHGRGRCRRAPANRPALWHEPVCAGHAQPDEATVQAAMERLAPLYAELGLQPQRPTQWCEDFAAQFEALVVLRPAVASFTFGILDAAQVARPHAAGCLVVGTATTVAEARAWAQWRGRWCVPAAPKPGGHRGTFLGDFTASMVGPGAGAAVRGRRRHPGDCRGRHRGTAGALQLYRRWARRPRRWARPFWRALNPASARVPAGPGPGPRHRHAAHPSFLGPPGARHCQRDDGGPGRRGRPRARLPRAKR